MGATSQGDRIVFKRNLEIGKIWGPAGDLQVRNTLGKLFLQSNKCERIQDRFRVYGVTNIGRFSVFFTSREISTGKKFAIKVQAAVPAVKENNPIAPFHDANTSVVLTMLYLKGGRMIAQVDLVYLHAPYIATAIEVFGVYRRDHNCLHIVRHYDCDNVTCIPITKPTS
jgi:hypothetical protein